MGAEQSTPAAAEQGTSSIITAKPSHAAPRPCALVVVGPSGVGKGTLIKKLMDGPDAAMFAFSVSHTTRKPRRGESDGEHYHFTTREDFEKGIAAGHFLEYAEVHSNLYGTSKQAVQTTLAAGKVAVLDIDVQGARQVRKAGIACITVFIAPPSMEELERRLTGRGSETPTSLSNRINNAKQEIASLSEHGLFDYVLVNDDLQSTARELARIGQRAMQGLPAEQGKEPEHFMLNLAQAAKDNSSTQHDVDADRTSSGASASTSNAAAAAAAGLAAAELPSAGSGNVSTTPKAPAKEALLPSQPLTRQGPTRAAAAALALTGNLASSSTASPAAAAATWGQPDEGQQHPASSKLLSPGPSGAAASAMVAAGLDAWRGKVALVTGASSGIGWAVCEALGTAGLRVVAIARRRERLQQLQQVLLSPPVGMAPGDFLPVVCDVTKEAEVEALPRIILKHWPDAGVDVLVNNAGLSRNNASLFDGNTTSWVEMVSTNILGNCMATRMAVQDMRRRATWGHVINMVGLSGHRIPDAAAGGTFFAATKFAVKAITEGLRQEARGAQVPLRVSGISPGMVETEFFAVRAFGDTAAAKAVTSSIQCLEPSDVANAILWCLSAPSHMEVNDIVIRPTQQVV